MNIQIEIKEIEPRSYAGVRRVVRYEGIAPACAEIFPRLLAWLTEKNLSPDAPPVTIYHSVNRETGEFDIQPSMFVKEEIEGEGDIESGVTASGEALFATHVGPYERLGETWSALFARALELKRTISKPSWEIYVDDPGKVDPSELRTEVFVPLDPEPGAGG